MAHHLLKRTFLAQLICAAALPCGLAQAQTTPFKVGVILPMTGPFASTGRQIDAAIKLYVAEHGAEVAGRRIELVLRDDAQTMGRVGYLRAWRRAYRGGAGLALANFASRRLGIRLDPPDINTAPAATYPQPEARKRIAAMPAARTVLVRTVMSTNVDHESA